MLPLFVCFREEWLSLSQQPLITAMDMLEDYRRYPIGIQNLDIGEWIVINERTLI